MSNKKIMAVASFGGHWVQLMRLNSLFSSCNTVFVSTEKDIKVCGEGKYIRVVDANFDGKLRLLILCVQILFYMMKERPDVIVTTGAAPGFFAIFWGKIFRKKTIWIDSIANSEEMSLSGKKIKPLADLWLTQWPEVAEKSGARFMGAVV